MQSYLEKAADLAASGALIRVKVGIPGQDSAEQPQPIEVLARIDTGVMHTIIQEGLASSLGLTPLATVRVTTLTDLTYECCLYQMRLLFAQGHATEICALEMPYVFHANQGVKCLIGRDVLKRGVLHYNGLTDTFSLSFSELRS